MKYFDNVLIQDWRIFGQPGWDDLFVNPKLRLTVDEHKVLDKVPLDNGIPNDWFFQNDMFDLG